MHLACGIGHLTSLGEDDQEEDKHMRCAEDRGKRRMRMERIKFCRRMAMMVEEQV